MRVRGFIQNIGPGQMMDGENMDEFLSRCKLNLVLPEGNLLTGVKLSPSSYDNDTGIATIMLDKEMSQEFAEIILGKHGIFIFSDDI
jgi:hypothetical protein